MKTKHTLAPWEMKPGNCVVGRNELEQPVAVAQVFKIVEGMKFPGEWTEETYANANLICAAPILYQVCLDGLKFLDSLPKTDDTMQAQNREAFRKMSEYAIALADNGVGV